LEIRPEECWWIPKGAPTLIAPKPSCDDELSQRVYRLLREIIKDPNVELPSLSPAVQQILVMIEDQDVDFGGLAEVLAQDQVLAAKVLRTANSAAYKSVSPISRLDVAIPRLGCEGLRSILMGRTLREMTAGLDGDLRQAAQDIWNRAIASAVMVSHMASTYQLLPGQASLVGLLHDLGMTGVLKVANDHQREFNEKVPRNVFDALCWEWHELIGHRIATAWELPEPLPHIIGGHHQLIDDDDPDFVYMYLVQFSDVSCSLLDIGPYVPYDFFKTPCVDTLGLKDDELTRRQLIEIPELIRERSLQY
jgi:HD-like signal output (HDOD) protein